MSNKDIFAVAASCKDIIAYETEIKRLRELVNELNEDLGGIAVDLESTEAELSELSQSVREVMYDLRTVRANVKDLIDEELPSDVEEQCYVILDGIDAVITKLASA